MFPQVTPSSAERALREGEAVAALRELKLWQALERKWTEAGAGARALLADAQDTTDARAAIAGSRAAESAVADLICAVAAAGPLLQAHRESLEPLLRRLRLQKNSEAVAEEWRRQARAAREIAEHPGFRVLCDRFAGIAHGLHLALEFCDDEASRKIQAALFQMQQPLHELRKLLRLGAVAEMYFAQQTA